MTGMAAHPINQNRTKDGEWYTEFVSEEGKRENINMAVDGTDTDLYPEGYARFCVPVPPNNDLFLVRMIGSMECAGRFASGGFGLGPVLTNGITLWLHNADDEPLLNFMAQHPIQTNVDYGHYCYDLDVQEWSNQYQTLLWRYTATKDMAQGTFWIKDSAKLCWHVADDLTERITDMNVRMAYIAVPKPYLHR